MNPHETTSAPVPSPVLLQGMLRILHQYLGIEVREQQLVTDFQVAVAPAASPLAVSAILAKLRDEGFAFRRVDPLRGNVWRISDEGTTEARKLAYEG